MTTEAFEPAKGISRVELNVAELDTPVVLQAGERYVTNITSVIAALDAHPSVQRCAGDTPIVEAVEESAVAESSGEATDDESANDEPEAKDEPAKPPVSPRNQSKTKGA